MIRRSEIKVQCHKRADESFGLTERELEDEPQGEDGLDSQV